MDAIDLLIAEELKRANENNPLFSSQHEGSSVIREEIEETKEALERVQSSFEKIWSDVRRDEFIPVKYQSMKLDVIHLIEEAIQVGAMCDKMIDSMNKL